VTIHYDEGFSEGSKGEGEAQAARCPYRDRCRRMDWFNGFDDGLWKALDAAVPAPIAIVRRSAPVKRKRPPNGDYAKRRLAEIAAEQLPEPREDKP
jgi:hypothetical protein